MAIEEKAKLITFKEFLEHVPPGQDVEVSDAFSQLEPPAAPLGRSGDIFHSLIAQRRNIWLLKPQLSIYCDSEECKGIRFLNSNDKAGSLNEDVNHIFIIYNCNNCRKSSKIFAIRILPLKSDSKVFKFGEDPPFGPPTPARAITLIGPNKELFLTGRRAENQGMGIGAFAYYRRVVENQKNRIFDAVIQATKKISPGNPVIQELEKAKSETQFIKAVEAIKLALPESLLINGQNSLKLLHSALSEGLHELPDAECLELASSIRTVLSGFADRLGQALEKKTELDDAVIRLAKGRVKKGNDKQPTDL